MGIFTIPELDGRPGRAEQGLVPEDVDQEPEGPLVRLLPVHQNDAGSRLLRRVRYFRSSV
jgi:hypothetical protein